MNKFSHNGALRAALDYAARGWPVLALVPGRKYPLADPEQAHGCNSPMFDPAIIAAVFGRHPNANVGLATGHVFDAVDYDGPHAPALAKAHGLFAPPTRTVRSPSGGFHVYIEHDDAIPTKTRVLQAGCECRDADGKPHPCGVDTRGICGLVAAPPSRFAGHAYIVFRDLPIAPWPQFVELCRALAPKPVPKSELRIPRGDGLIARIKAAWTVEGLAERLGARLIGRGDQMKAKCPLHGERTGYAFVIWRRDQRFACFGKCNLHGDVVDLHVAAKARGLL